MLGAGARAGRVSDAQGWCIAIGKRNLHFACSSKHLRCRRFYARCDEKDGNIFREGRDESLSNQVLPGQSTVN